MPGKARAEGQRFLPDRERPERELLPLPEELLFAFGEELRAELDRDADPELLRRDPLLRALLLEERLGVVPPDARGRDAGLRELRVCVGRAGEAEGLLRALLRALLRVGALRDDLSDERPCTVPPRDFVYDGSLRERPPTLVEERERYSWLAESRPDFDREGFGSARRGRASEPRLPERGEARSAGAAERSFR